MGNILQNAVEDFKKLPTGGKVAIGGVFALVIFLGILSYEKNKNAGANSAAARNATSLDPTANKPGVNSAFPGVTSGNYSVPYLPSGVNPVYNPTSGTLEGFQQASATPPAQVGATPSTSPTPYYGLLGANVSYAEAAKKYPGQNIITGKQGRLWVVQDGKQNLITSGTGPPVTNSGYAPGSPQNTPGAYGGGGFSWQSMMRRRMRTYTPRYGDNMNEVATKLGLKGGWQAFGVSSFEHGKPITIPAMPGFPGFPAIPGVPGVPSMSVNMEGMSVNTSPQGTQANIRSVNTSSQTSVNR